jgi:hypothetical protein
MKGRGLVLALAGLLAGCAVYVPRPDALMAGGDEALLSELHRGRELYVDKCSGCHSLHPVDAFDDARWKAEVLEMSAAKKIRLTESERDTLLRYLTAANGR